ncbi:MAG: 4-hydroxy-tetrahydrodipicolinate reductase [Candidatus Spechtbacteria bacterium SB0662_bin_43]|uniref:4-hydroxy-tetrahydrodipicolinate reductase n=1 Tax=Candidatus Spechtbacteria bacterium SB0662_bin_43 TaxID=2604897 RepID=A0A845DLH3_9BACT|nr:4-hydroxy-tetrahydrodipicolinate reductase [Candidatus Spechtbacteria bacterium SB0662_bin_43]
MTQTRVAISGTGAMGIFILNAIEEATTSLQIVGILNRNPGETDPKEKRRSTLPTYSTASGYVFHVAKTTKRIIPVSDSFDALSEWKPDVVVDFSHPEWTKQLLPECVERKISFVVGTTGLSHDFIDNIKQQVERKQLRLGARVASDGNVIGGEAGIGGFIVPNFSLGAVALQSIARRLAGAFDNVAIIEQHHTHKADAPSGTAFSIAQTIRNARGYDVDDTSHEDTHAISIHSVRMPDSPACHTIIFGGTGESLTIKHESLNKDSFMPGILQCIWRAQYAYGVETDIEDLLFSG